MAKNESGGEESSKQEQPSAPINQNSETQTRAATQNSGDKNSKPSNDNFDRDLVRWTRIVGVFTGLLFVAAVLQFCAMRRQLNIMQGQLEEMRFEQRPWIYADIGPGGRIFRNQSGGLTFPVAFKVHNTGHLPATYVSPDIEGYLSGEGGVVGSLTVRERQRKRCGLPLQQPNASDQIGATVFPGQSVLLGANVGMTADEIGEVRELEHKIGKVSDFFPTPWGAGCIRYRSPDGAFHQTGIAFTVSMGKPGKGGVYALPIDPTSIDPQNLIIGPWIEGGTAYAN